MLRGENVRRAHGSTVTNSVLHWAGALRHIAVLLSLRLLPFAVWGTVRASAGVATKVLIAAGYAAFAVLGCYLGASSSVLFVGLGAAYYWGLCLGANRLSALMAEGAVTRGAAIVLVFVVFLLAPGVALPGRAAATFLVVGWDLALSAYSYCVETSRPAAVRPPMSECLFFLLVNPTLVYAARGAPLKTPAGHDGLLRAFAGAALVVANVSVIWPLADHLHMSIGTATSRAVAVTGALYGIVRLVSIYAAHSGLASIQIGLMRQLGWQVPERYCYPLAATSPVDFWRRWNTYVRTWLEVYVFLPIARKAARRSTGWWGQAAAAMMTLFISGLIHDAYVFAGRQTTGAFRTTQLFLAASALLALWRLTANLGRALRRRLGGRQVRWLDAASTVLSRCGVATALVSAALVWG